MNNTNNRVWIIVHDGLHGVAISYLEDSSVENNQRPSTYQFSLMNTIHRFINNLIRSAFTKTH